jgi:hypothetical protein
MEIDTHFCYALANLFVANVDPSIMKILLVCLSVVAMPYVLASA